MSVRDSVPQSACAARRTGACLGELLSPYGVLTALAMCALLALVAGTGRDRSTDDRDRERFSDEAEKAADLRGRRIKAELLELGGKHEWAGDYYSGDGLGVNVFLVVSPKNGYVFEWHGCLGLYDRNYGDVTAVDGKLRLSFAFANKQEGFAGIATEFTPVAWGSRRYLIPSSDMVGFCNEVNARAEPRDESRGMYLLREGDEKVKVVGPPNVPPQYERYLLTRPVRAHIVKVKRSTTRPSAGNWNFRDTTVTLDAGRADRLLVGMELHVVKPRNTVESARVSKVEEHSAEAIMTQHGKDSKPAVGWELSTLPPWRVGVIPGKALPSSSHPAAETQPRENDVRARQ